MRERLQKNSNEERKKGKEINKKKKDHEKKDIL